MAKNDVWNDIIVNMFGREIPTNPLLHFKESSAEWQYYLKRNNICYFKSYNGDKLNISVPDGFKLELNARFDIVFKISNAKNRQKIIFNGNELHHNIEIKFISYKNSDIARENYLKRQNK